ncbi:MULTISPECIES: hypothetical protein [unclassified Methylobacterium]|nr:MULTISPECIES: hypothetical protein [unclassified Methylobacterium]
MSDCAEETGEGTTLGWKSMKEANTPTSPTAQRPAMIHRGAPQV